MPLFNVEIRATNNYTAGLAVTENPLSIGGGWSEKMPAFLSPGGGSGTALVRNKYFFLKGVFPLLVLLYYMQCWGYEIEGEMHFRYYDAAKPFVLTFYIGEKGAANARISPEAIVIPGPIEHTVHTVMTYSVAGSTLNVTVDFLDPGK